MKNSDYNSILNIAVATLMFAVGVPLLVSALSDIGIITSELEDELKFMELTQPRIDFIEAEVRNCISFHLQENNLDVDVFDDNLLSFSSLAALDDWVMFALLGESLFPREYSVVHNEEQFGQIKSIIQEHCPADAAMKSEYQYWFNRTHSTPITYWKRSHIFINY